MIRAILACDSKGGIGLNGSLPWPHNSEDLEHFKCLTSGQTVIMGRNTWESKDIPVPLKNRRNVVITSDPKFKPEGAIIYNDVNHALQNEGVTGDIFIIGGAKLFSSVMNQIDILHLTLVSGNYDCDTFISLVDIEDKFIKIDSVKLNKSSLLRTYLAKERVDEFSAKTKRR